MALKARSWMKTLTPFPAFLLCVFGDAFSFTPFDVSYTFDTPLNGVVIPKSFNQNMDLSLRVVRSTAVWPTGPNLPMACCRD